MGAGSRERGAVPPFRRPAVPPGMGEVLRLPPYRPVSFLEPSPLTRSMTQRSLSCRLTVK